MQRLTWNKDLRLGVKSIDEHHRTMIHIANEFINAANQGSTPKVLSKILIRLREHAVAHLKMEDGIMAATRYEQRAKYALENAHLKVAMKGFHHHLNVAGQVTVKDIQFLKHSLLQHIRNSNHAISRSMMMHCIGRA